MFRKTYTFDDVLIVPGLSTLGSRSEVDLSVTLSKGLKFNIPITPANMKTVVNEKVAREFYALKGLCLLHRFMPIGEQIEILANIKNDHADAFNYIGVSVGIKTDDYDNVDRFVALGVKIICVDVAHGHSSGCANMVYYIAQKHPKVFVIAGNVATGKGAEYLWNSGADAVKVGVGGGSICATRTETGCGVPQLSALMDVYECWEERLSMSVSAIKFIIADGGCSKVGDLVKSLCFSDMVMCGNLFSGSEDGPGDIIEQNGKRYKRYYGSSTHKDDHIEGVKALVEAKPSIKNIVNKMTDGISSGCSYTGSFNLVELKQKAKFIEITHSPVREGGSHDVFVLSENAQ